MFRRLFWFVLGAVTGVMACVRLRAALADARENVTPANVLRAVRAAVVSVARRLWSAFESVRESGNPGHVHDPSVAAPTSSRRHLATRPSSHHG
ncbi:MAG: hypothetical protein RLZZ305_1806 [Actinomycetota bacterium]|jgi:hypothetical protein